MSLIIPDSIVSLYTNIPITNGEQIVFKNKAEQSAYFASKKTAARANCTYIKKTGRLRIEYSTSVVLNSDYISFINPSFENTTFYAEIIDFEYVNNETTDILYSIDWFQTFMFDVRYHASSIVREHLTENQYISAVDNPWRRDILELMTDEGLPVGESLETIYTTGTISGGIPSGNRFDMLSAFPLITEPLKELKIVMYLTSIRPMSDLSVSEITAFREFLGYWSTVNGETIGDVTTFNFNNIFTSNSENFCRGYATLQMSLSAYGNLSLAMGKLAALGVTGNVVGLYILPAWASNGGSYRTGFVVPKLTGHDPKLNTFPFRYIRMKSPLDIKEYRIDLFSILKSGSDNFIGFTLTSNVSGAPIIALMPEGYKVDSENPNYYERLEYSVFPQVAFSTDAYLTYLSNQYQNAMLSNTSAGIGQMIANKTSAETTQNLQAINATSKVVGSAAGLGTSIATGNPIGMMGAGTNIVNTVGGFNAQAQQNEANVRAAQQNIDTIVESNTKRGSGYSAVYDGVKRAFVANDYHPGSTSGYLPYDLDKLDYTCEIVTLAEDILDKYDDYFICNGYKSLRNGIPHVCNYMNNGAEIPHFNTFDGDTFTFVQTENMKVTGGIQAACTAIENLFNSGCRFLKVV